MYYMMHAPAPSLHKESTDCLIYHSHFIIKCMNKRTDFEGLHYVMLTLSTAGMQLALKFAKK